MPDLATSDADLTMSDLTMSDLDPSDLSTSDQSGRRPASARTASPRAAGGWPVRPSGAVPPAARSAARRIGHPAGRPFRRGQPFRRLPVAVAVAALGGALLAGCAGQQGNTPFAVVSGPSSTAEPNTIPLDPPDAKPALDLTDQDGKRYDLVSQTAGHPTLLYFGYTHCPDICPTTMADIAGAAQKLPPAERGRLRVVFVSTDPARDTPQRLKAWLGAIDPAFIGLTGDFDQVRSAARSLGISVAPAVRNPDGSETVTHGAEVVVFSPEDGKAHFLYTSGVSEQQYAADLPKIVKGVTP